MAEISRRRFIQTSAIAAAAAGTAAAAPAVIGAATTAGAVTANPVVAAAAADPTTTGVVAHVVDPAAGVIAIYAGTQQFTLTDPAIARALTDAAK